MSRANVCLSVLFVVLVSSVFPTQISADETWTQWGGDQRDFSIDNVKISAQPVLTEKWRRDLGNGYSAILCDGNRLYTMYRRDDNEYIICMDCSDGKTVWEKYYPAPLSKDADPSFGKGPNATPLLIGDRLICVGFNSDVHCLNKANGEIIWKTNLIKDYQGTSVDLGYSASPIHYGDNVILPVGGKGKAIMAFAVTDGSVSWSALDYQNSYGTPLLFTDNGVDQFVLASTDDVISVDPANGTKLWSFPLKNQWNTHAFVPVWDAKNKILFVSSFRQSHGLNVVANESTAGDGEEVSFEKKWSDNRSGIGFSNAVLVGDIICGSTGGTGSPLVTAFDSVGGSVLWKERGFAKCNFLAVNEHLVLLDAKGVLAVAKPDSRGLNVIKRQKVLSAEKVWTVPTLVDNTLYMRDQKEILAMEVK